MTQPVRQGEIRHHKNDYVYSTPTRVVTESWWLDVPPEGFTARAARTVRELPEEGRPNRRGRPPKHVDE